MTNIQKVIKIGAISLAIFIIILIFNSILFAVGIFTNFGGNDTIDINENYKNITNIEIDVASADIIIKKGKSFKVEATDISDDIKITDKNSTLKIEENIKIFGNITSTIGKIVIYVPEDDLRKLDIESGASKVLIEDISISDLEISQGAGLVEINNIDARGVDIDGGAGNIAIKASNLNNVEIDAGVGKIEIEAYITGNNQIDCGVGEIELSLLGNEEDYRITADKGIGNVSINGKEYTDRTYGNGTNKIDIDGGVGSISINFENNKN